MKQPAHKTLIQRYLNWDRVEQRLSQYEHIRHVFSIEDMKKCSDKSPYFSHYLAWRFGTWENEQWFAFFDQLLARSIALKGWNKSRIPKGCEFENFWSFVWELQVGVFFAALVEPSNVAWINSGPDLQVAINGELLFVECTTYRKSFGLEEFINDLLGLIDPRIKAEHNPFIKFSLQKTDKETFLDRLFRPFLNDAFLQDILQKARQRSPFLLPCPDGVENLFIYVEDDNSISVNTDHPLRMAGAPEEYLKVAIEEVHQNKKYRNKLDCHHPNLLVINFLLGIDFQIARMLRHIPKFALDEVFDGTLITICGIDEIPSFEKSSVLVKGDHPLRLLIGSV